MKAPRKYGCTNFPGVGARQCRNVIGGEIKNPSNPRNFHEYVPDDNLACLNLILSQNKLHYHLRCTSSPLATFWRESSGFCRQYRIR